MSTRDVVQLKDQVSEAPAPKDVPDLAAQALAMLTEQLRADQSKLTGDAQASWEKGTKATEQQCHEKKVQDAERASLAALDQQISDAQRARAKNQSLRPNAERPESSLHDLLSGKGTKEDLKGRVAVRDPEPVRDTATPTKTPSTQKPESGQDASTWARFQFAYPRTAAAARFVANMLGFKLPAPEGELSSKGLPAVPAQPTLVAKGSVQSNAVRSFPGAPATLKSENGESVGTTIISFSSPEEAAQAGAQLHSQVSLTQLNAVLNGSQGSKVFVEKDFESGDSLADSSAPRGKGGLTPSQTSRSKRSRDQDPLGKGTREGHDSQEDLEIAFALGLRRDAGMA